MRRAARNLLIAITFGATQVVLTSNVIIPALAQNEKTPTTSASPGTAPAAPTKKKLVKPDDAANSKKNRELRCGNGQCYSLWQELTNPHDPRYQARLKVEKAYRDCMARCTAAKQMQ